MLFGILRMKRYFIDALREILWRLRWEVRVSHTSAVGDSVTFSRILRVGRMLADSGGLNSALWGSSPTRSPQTDAQFYCSAVLEMTAFTFTLLLYTSSRQEEKRSSGSGFWLNVLSPVASCVGLRRREAVSKPMWPSLLVLTSVKARRDLLTWLGKEGTYNWTAVHRSRSRRFDLSTLAGTEVAAFQVKSTCFTRKNTVCCSSLGFWAEANKANLWMLLSTLSLVRHPL